MSKRFSYRGARVEVWRGNDAEGSLGYLPWFFRPLTEPVASRIHWHIMGPRATQEASVELAKFAIDRAKDTKAALSAGYAETPTCTQKA